MTESKKVKFKVSISLKDEVKQEEPKNTAATLEFGGTMLRFHQFFLSQLWTLNSKGVLPFC